MSPDGKDPRGWPAHRVRCVQPGVHPSGRLPPWAALLVIVAASSALWLGIWELVRTLF